MHWGKEYIVGWQGHASDYAQLVARVVQHLCWMLLPDEILTAEELEEAVDLILQFQDIFVGPDTKVGFTHRVKH